MELFLKVAAGDVVCEVVRCRAWRAVKYVSPVQVVRATRVLVRKKVPKSGPIDIRLTFGKPNAREREFIRVCKKAGMVFPLRQIQIQMPPNHPKPKAVRRG